MRGASTRSPLLGIRSLSPRSVLVSCLVCIAAARRTELDGRATEQSRALHARVPPGVPQSDPCRVRLVPGSPFVKPNRAADARRGDDDVTPRTEASTRSRTSGSLDAEGCHCTLAVMATAGLYETSGIGSTTPVSPPRAASAAASSPSPPARAASARSRRCSTLRGTASRDSSPPRSSRAGSGWALFASEPEA